MNLQGKIALVTGASRGIGQATALKLAASGAFVIVHYGSNRESAEATLGKVKEAGGDGFVVQADFADSSTVESFFSEIDRKLNERFGSNQFDILVNNAAVAPFVEFADTDAATFDRTFEINVKSLFFVTQKALTRLRENGRIINVSTAITRTAFPGVPVYAMSKGAVDVMTLHLAPLLGSRNITVNAVAPGAIETDMSAWLRSEEGEATAKQIQAIPRVGQPVDVANVVAFLAAPESAWITGRVIDASGGTKL